MAQLQEHNTKIAIYRDAQIFPNIIHVQRWSLIYNYTIITINIPKVRTVSIERERERVGQHIYGMLGYAHTERDAQRQSPYLHTESPDIHTQSPYAHTQSHHISLGQ